MIVTRFAPSPTGHLHLGHAFAALRAFRAAEGGRFILRIEDIDRLRARPEFEQAIYDDLAWLGLSWQTPVRRQSEHFDDYRAALEQLDAQGLLYPCFCTRKDIVEEIARAGSAPHIVSSMQTSEGPIYPGTCRNLLPDERAARIKAGAPYALRLDVAKASASISGRLSFEDRGQRHAARPEDFGDIVLARRDMPTSYHLAVTLDDGIQGVTLVTRGEDLLAATHIQRLLQALLHLPVPAYAHHRLILDSTGKKFSKRDATATLRELRASGATPADVKRIVGLNSE